LEKHFFGVVEESVSELRLLLLETKELLDARRHGGASSNVERLMSLNQASSLQHTETEEYTLSADPTNPFEGTRRHSRSKYLKSEIRSSQRSTECSQR